MSAAITFGFGLIRARIERGVANERRGSKLSLIQPHSWQSWKKQHRAQAHQYRRRQNSYLAALCGLGHWSRRIENFSAVERQVSEALDQVVRASSAVECFNSSLRPYVSVKKHLSQGFLALIALYHNTRPLPQRGNKTPLQLAGVDLGDDDWVRLIEHEMRYGRAAQRV